MLRIEVIGFLCVLAAILAYRMLTGSIALHGLLADKASGLQVSPERVQLLIATLAIGLKFLGQAVHGAGVSMPDVSGTSLTIFGGSGSIYAATKALRMWTGNKA